MRPQTRGLCVATALALALAARAAAAVPQTTLTLFAGPSIDGAGLSSAMTRPFAEEAGQEVFLGAALSQGLGRPLPGLRLDAEAGAGARFGRFGGVEGWGALYLRFDALPWSHRVPTALGASTGLSVVSRLPHAERFDDGVRLENRSHVLHYFSPEIAFGIPGREGEEIVLRWHHRSGIFGAIGGVRDGSNVVALGWRIPLGR